MPKQVDVLVKDISTDENGRPTRTNGEEKVLPYNSVKILNDPDSPRYQIVGEVESVDKDGNVTLRAGNPNLEAQHRPIPQQPKKDAGPVISSGPTVKELEQQAEIDRLKQQLAAAQTPAAENNPPKERKKPGPKAKAEKALEGAAV